MTCDCKKTIEDKLTARFKDQAPDATDHKVRISGYALILGEVNLTQKGYMPMKCTAKHPLKKGGIKEKTETQDMIFSFCPFCGTKYDPVPPTDTRSTFSGAADYDQCIQFHGIAGVAE